MVSYELLSLFVWFFNTSHYSLGLEYWNHTTNLERIVGRYLIAKQDPNIRSSWVSSNWGPNNQYLTNLDLQNPQYFAEKNKGNHSTIKVKPHFFLLPSRTLFLTVLFLEVSYGFLTFCLQFLPHSVPSKKLNKHL